MVPSLFFFFFGMFFVIVIFFCLLIRLPHLNPPPTHAPAQPPTYWSFRHSSVGSFAGTASGFGFRLRHLQNFPTLPRLLSFRTANTNCCCWYARWLFLDGVVAYLCMHHHCTPLPQHSFLHLISSNVQAIGPRFSYNQPRS